MIVYIAPNAAMLNLQWKLRITCTNWVIPLCLSLFSLLINMALTAFFFPIAIQTIDVFAIVALSGIVSRLLSTGTVLVATSNRAPEDLNQVEHCCMSYIWI